MEIASSTMTIDEARGNTDAYMNIVINRFPFPVALCHGLVDHLARVLALLVFFFAFYIGPARKKRTESSPGELCALRVAGKYTTRSIFSFGFSLLISIFDRAPLWFLRSLAHSIICDFYQQKILTSAHKGEAKSETTKVTPGTDFFSSIPSLPTLCILMIQLFWRRQFTSLRPPRQGVLHEMARGVDAP